jgi:hypothetical protein
LILTDTLTLEAVLGGAVAANQPEFHVDYFVRDNNSPQQNIAWQPPKPSTLRGALNDTTDVTLISPTTGRYSTQGFVAEVTRASIYNKDTGSVTVTVKTTDGSTDRIICKATLETGEFISYANGLWQAFTSDGSLKTNAISYAEGTWTPGLTFATPGDLSVVYSVLVGTYTQVGRLRFLTLDLVTSTFTHTTASGNLNITGCPFTSMNSPAATYRGSLQWTGITKANYTEAIFALANNSATLLVQMSGSGQAIATVATGDMPTGGTVQLRGNITFQV